MKEGLLWYVSDENKGMQETVENAVDYFKSKYGQAPLACYIHPESTNSEFTIQETVKVIPNEKVIKNHIWLEIPQD